MLQVRDLVIRYPGLDVPALSIGALAIAAGECVAVTGPSGSGKTTLVNAITGLERVREGVVAWDGTDLATLGEAARDRWRAVHVGLVMQEFHLFEGLSARDNVLLPARLQSARLGRSLAPRADALLDRLGLTRPGQRVETLSRGEMQRVALARALLRQPPVLIADEPSASLDAARGAEVGHLLRDMAAELGATLIVVTHDEHLAGLMDRRVRLRGGQISAGEPAAAPHCRALAS